MLSLTVSGTPWLCGLAHGEAFRTQIRELAGIRTELLQSKFGFTPGKIDAIATKRLKVMEYPCYRSFLEELEGIADGANVSKTAVIVLNDYTDFRDEGFQGAASSVHDDDTGGCSAFSVRTSTFDITAQTWDMHASARPYVLHLTVEGNTRVELLTLTGCLGMCGVSESGVAVLINNLFCKETNLGGLIWPALVRGMLLARSADDAYFHLARYRAGSGHNYMIADARKTINVETTGLRYLITKELTGPGAYFHTNHYLDPKLQGAAPAEMKSKTSEARYAQLETFFSGLNLDRTDEESIAQNAFCDGGLGCVNVPAPAPDNPHDPMTCGGMRVNMGERRGVFFAGNYAGRDYRLLNF